MALLYKGNKLISVLNKVEIVQGDGGVETAKDAVNTETIQTLEAVPENPTSESYSIIRVNGVIYVLTNTEGGN